MQDTTKPLHVQVAEAIGWKWYVHSDNLMSLHPGKRFLGNPILAKDSHFFLVANGNEPMTDDPYRSVLRYDTDWDATGPLIEKYGITLEHLPCVKHEGCDKLPWDAVKYEWFDMVAGKQHRVVAKEAGTTALISVCHLILKLKEAGKL